MKYISFPLFGGLVWGGWGLRGSNSKEATSCGLFFRDHSLMPCRSHQQEKAVGRSLISAPNPRSHLRYPPGTGECLPGPPTRNPVPRVGSARKATRAAAAACGARPSSGPGGLGGFELLLLLFFPSKGTASQWFPSGSHPSPPQLQVFWAAPGGEKAHGR